MKLKIYRIALLTVLFLLFGLNIFFIVLTGMRFANTDNISDNILFLLALLVSLACIFLEIFNTFVSLKNGSNFIRVLVYEKEKLVKKGLYLAALFLVVFLGLTVYAILLLCGLQLPLSGLAKELLYMIVVFFSLITVDSIFILLYPLVADVDHLAKQKDR